MVYLTLGALLLSTLVALYDKVLDPQPEKKRRGLLLLYVGALVLAGGAAVAQSLTYAKDRKAADDQIRALQQNIEATKGEAQGAREQAAQGRAISELIQATVGDLSKLNALGGDYSYYVVLAEAPSPVNLAESLDRIEHQFRGARKSGLASIVGPLGDPPRYRLVFGRQLTLAAAEVFQRFATNHHFPNGIARVLPDQPLANTNSK